MSDGGVLGALIAGGASRRMGGAPKAEIEFDGETLGQRAVATLRTVADEVAQFGGAPIRGVAVEVIADAHASAGPAAGIEAALAYGFEAVVVLGVDLPFATPRLLRACLRHVERGAAGCAPFANDCWHPLCAAYSATLLHPLAARLATGDRRLQRLMDRYGVKLEGAELERAGGVATVTNVNTPADLANARQRLTGGADHRRRRRSP